AALAARDAEDFVNSGVIVHVVVDAVAPAVAPAVGIEQILDHGGAVVAFREIDGAAVDDQRPARVIGNETIVPEVHRARFPRASKLESLALARTPEARGTLDVRLEVFNNRHDDNPCS